MVPQPDGSPEGFDGALGGLSQEGLELGEGLLDRVAVGWVGRQIDEPHPTRFDCLGNALGLVRGEVVLDHDVAGAQGGCEAALDVGSEDRRIIGRSTTKGALQPVSCSPATKVVVFQWPCGTGATTRAPRLARS